MRALRVKPPVSRIKREAIFELGRARERHRYFRRALTTTAFFSFAGSLTFKKSRWDSHFFTIFRCSRASPPWLALPQRDTSHIPPVLTEIACNCTAP